MALVEQEEAGEGDGGLEGVGGRFWFQFNVSAIAASFPTALPIRPSPSPATALSRPAPHAIFPSPISPPPLAPVNSGPATAEHVPTERVTEDCRLKLALAFLESSQVK